MKKTWISMLGVSLAAVSGLLAQSEGGGGAVEAKKQSEQPAKEVSLKGKVAVVRISPTGLSDIRELKFIHAAIDRAEKEGATGILFSLEDCLGGLAWETGKLLDRIKATSLPTHAFVRGRVAGAGALLLAGVKGTYLQSDALIGGEVKAISVDPKFLPPTLGDKTYSDIIEKAAAMAVERGRDGQAIRALVDPSVSIALDGVEISSGGLKNLKLSSEQAVSLQDGKRLLAEGVAADENAALSAAGLSPDGVVPLSYDRPSTLKKLGGSKPVAGESGRKTGAGAKPKDPLARDDTSYQGKIVVIKVGTDDLMRQSWFDFTERTLKKANSDGAEAVIFDMHTPGGRAWETADLMMKALQDVTIPTYAFVNNQAVSAGSLIAIATDRIYMKPTGSIGAAAIVTSMGDITGDMRTKVYETMLDVAASVAESKGHHVEVVRAFIEPKDIAKLTHTVVDKYGAVDEIESVVAGDDAEKILSLSPSQAIEPYNGKPLLAAGIVNSIEELIEREGLQGTVIQAEQTGFEVLRNWIEWLSPFLIILGVAGAWIEFKTPGFGVPGLVATAAFVIFFLGNYVLGNLVGFETISLFLLGVALLAVELFVTPGFMFVGFLGLGLMIGTLVYAMVDKLSFQGDYSVGNLLDIFSGPLFSVAIGLAGAMLLIIWIMKYLPDTKIMSRLILKKAVGGAAGDNIAAAIAGAAGGATTMDSSGLAQEEDGASSSGSRSSGRPDVVGMTGVASTGLRPSGKAIFGDELIDVTSDGDFLEAGSKVRILRQEGNKIVVIQIP